MYQSLRHTWMLVAVIGLALAFAPRAGATGMGTSHPHPSFGISLADLVDGGEFSSLDGLLTFSGFEADLDGLPQHKLDKFRIIPTDDGFKLLTPLSASFGKSQSIDLHYTVEASEGYAIDGAGLGALGLGLGKASAGAEKSFGDVGDDLSVVFGGASCLSDYLRSSKHSSKGGFGGGPFSDFDFTHFDDPQGSLDVWESAWVESESRHIGLALLPVVINKFKVVPVGTPVPEPGTLVLLGVAVAGVARSARRRSQ